MCCRSVRGHLDLGVMEYVAMLDEMSLEDVLCKDVVLLEELSLLWQM